MAYGKDVPRNLPSPFGQNLLSNCWDIADMDISPQNKCYMDKCPHDTWRLLKMAQER